MGGEQRAGLPVRRRRQRRPESSMASELPRRNSGPQPEGIWPDNARLGKVLRASQVRADLGGSQEAWLPDGAPAPLTGVVPGGTATEHRLRSGAHGLGHAWHSGGVGVCDHGAPPASPFGGAGAERQLAYGQALLVRGRRHARERRPGPQGRRSRTHGSDGLVSMGSSVAPSSSKCRRQNQS